VETYAPHQRDKKIKKQKYLKAMNPLSLLLTSGQPYLTSKQSNLLRFARSKINPDDIDHVLESGSTCESVVENLPL